ncbi:MAG TPA: DUF2269 family protein [Actinomycetota bacterium]|nr:DUF2269 family protein [Actinomycetota bacterium]
MSWFQVFLILHILAVVVAFGPSFAFPLIGALIEKSPQQGAFGLQIMTAIEERMIIPLSTVVPVLGVGLIYTGHFDLWKSEWLVITIVLYPIFYFFGLLVQTPRSNRLLKMALDMQAAGPPPAEAGGPPAEFQKLQKQVQMGGAFLGLMVIVFIVLMVWKPGSCTGIC